MGGRMTSPDGPAADRPLRHRVARGVAWNASSTGYGLLLQTVSTVFLARIIAPSAFGLYAVAAVFYFYGNLAANLGLGTAIIQRNPLTRVHLATAFWLNVVLGVALTVALSLAAPMIAALLGQPELEGLLRLISISYTINLAVVPLAILERELRFRSVAVLESAAASVALAVALVGGHLGWGATALAMQLLVQTFLVSIAAMVLAGYLPTCRPSRQALSELLSVSGWLTAGNLIGYWSANTDTLTLGATQPPAQVGYYNRAFNLLTLPQRTLANTITRVIVPALSSIQADRERTKEAWLGSVRVMALMSFPICLGMSAAAPAIVQTLWGSTWAPVVPLLQLLALAGVPWCIAVAAEWLLFARGRARTFFWLACGNTAVSVTAVLVGLPWGAVGVATAMLVRSFLIVPMYVHWCLREIGVGYGDLGRAVVPTAIDAVVMGILVLGAGHLLSGQPSLLVVTAQVLLGVVVFVGLVRVFSPGHLDEVLALMRRRGGSAAAQTPADAA